MVPQNVHHTNEKISDKSHISMILCCDECNNTHVCCSVTFDLPYNLLSIRLITAIIRITAS